MTDERTAPAAPGPDQVAVRPGIAERLSRMIQLPTVSAELDRRGTAPFETFAELLTELYPLVHEHLELERHTEFGLLYRWRGRTEADPIVLMAHFDVVPVDERDPWTFPPFEGRIADGSVHGRGTLDDKGPLIVILEAVENLLAAGHVPARDVYLAFGGNEETFGDAAREMARVVQERGITPFLVLDEGGAVVDAPLPFLQGQAAMVGVGEKGFVSIRLTAPGTGGHASAPPAITAVRRIARAIDALEPGTFRPHLPVAVRRMLSLLGAQAAFWPRQLYRFLAAFPWITGRVFAAMGGEPAAMVRTTVAATMVSGGTAPNVLPSSASATLNLRIALGETVEGTVARVREQIDDPGVQVSVLEGDDPSPESPADGPAFRAITDAVAASYPEAATVPYVMMQASDARHWHRFAPAVYRFAPLAMSAAQRASVHGVDEHVTIADLERGERFHRALIAGLD